MNLLRFLPTRVLGISVFVTTAILGSGGGTGIQAATPLGTPSPDKHFFWGEGSNPNPPSPASLASNLFSHGGTVEVHPSVYVVFWGPKWQTGFTATGTKSEANPNPRTYTNKDAMRYVTRMFQNIGGSTWNGVQTQYCQNVPAGTFDCSQYPLAEYITNPRNELKGVWIDPSPIPDPIITTGLVENVTHDPIATEALKTADKFGYHNDATYFVLTEPGHVATGYAYKVPGAYCAYHTQVDTPGVPVTGIKYSFIPYVMELGAGCRQYGASKTDDAFGHGYFDPYSITIGHEYAEAETDPNNIVFQDGWNDNSTSENGDKCADGHGYFNVPMGPYTFGVQPMWSNKITGCAISLSQTTPS